MSKKMRLLIIAILITSINLYSESNNEYMIVNVTYGDIVTQIYKGKIRIDIRNVIENCKIIENNLTKTAVIEGTYYIEIYENNRIKKYEVQNNDWIYDKNNKKYYRCSLIEELRNLYFNYLFRKEILPEK